MKNKKLREQVKSYIIVTLACVLYALSFDWFYAPNGFTVCLLYTSPSPRD